MRIFSVLIMVLFSMWATAAQAQDRLLETGTQATAPLILAASEVDDDDDDAEEVIKKGAESAEKAVTKSAEETRTELRNLVEQSHDTVNKVAKDIHTATGISGKRAFGIAAGMVAGAVVVDMMGGGGLATIAVMAGGGFIGNWIMSE